MDQLLLRPEEAAQLLGIGRSKLYELIAAGTIESVLLDRCRRIPRAALDDFVQLLRSQDHSCGDTTAVQLDHLWRG